MSEKRALGGLALQSSIREQLVNGRKNLDEHLRRLGVDDHVVDVYENA